MMRAVCADEYMSRRFDVRESNCWHLVRDVWRDMTGVDLGDLTPHRTDTASLGGAVDGAASRFRRLESMANPCIVLMRRRRDMPHVGVLMRWRVLHLTADGARNTWISDLMLQWDRVEFYLPLEGAAP